VYSAPYIDIDEWRTEPQRHRYVHGGFKGSDCRFSMYFPPAELYQGRFFQPLLPVSGTENAVPATQGAMMGDAISFAFESGGYVVESNLGRTDMFPGQDPTIVGFRASAAVAEYSRLAAAQMYGPRDRIYGYVYGGSGGAYKTMACVENTKGVWDGAVPFVHGSPYSMPNLFTVQFHAQRVLKDKWPSIVDALQPGGGGDPYEGLNEEEGAALLEVTRMGFPPRTWFAHERVAFGYTGVFASIIDQVVALDPSYFEDFWTKPGYLGANPPESLLKARVKHVTTLTQVVMSDEARRLGMPMSMSGRFGAGERPVPSALRLKDLPQGEVRGATITVISGPAKGLVVNVAGLAGDLAVIGFSEANLGLLGKLAPGEEIQLDNDRYLALQTYQRHQVPPPEFPAWDQYRGADGRPIYPQRPKLVGPTLARGAAGSIQSGDFDGKMIVLQTMMDEAAYPWQADWYRKKVEERLGSKIDERYRLWFIDNAMHTTPVVAPTDPKPVITTHVTSYAGALQQALRDLAAWCEKGEAPPASTRYEVEDCQVKLPAKAAERRGVQPVVTLAVAGGRRAAVEVGQPVEFIGVVQAPPGAGKIVEADWDFEGGGDFPFVDALDGHDEQKTVTRTHTFTKPGTYFPALRAACQREPGLTFGKVLNLDRVRVVVS
jgi:hypothetical protein